MSPTMPVLIFYLLINIFKWIFRWRNIHWKQIHKN